MTGSNPKTTGARAQTRPRLKILVAVLACAVIGLVVVRPWRSPSPETTFAKARKALAAGDLDAVAQALRILRDEADYVGHCRLLEGALLLRNGRFAESLYSLREAARQPTLELEALTLAGQAQYHLGRVGEAQQLWSQAIRLNPSAVDAHRWMGVLYYDLGAMDQALEHLEKVSKLAPEDSRPDRLMGSIYQDFERHQLAAKHYQTSLQRDPNQRDRAEVLLELAESQTKSADFKRALATLALCPDSVGRAALRAECYYALGDREQALELTSLVLEKTPEHLPSALLRAKILLGEDRASDAAALLEKTSQFHPKDYLLLYTLSQAYSKIGDETKARETLAESEKLKKVWQEFSRLNTEAIHQPRNAELRYQLGVLAQDLGRADLAESWIRAALALDPGHEKAAEALSKNEKDE